MNINNYAYLVFLNMIVHSFYAMEKNNIIPCVTQPFSISQVRKNIIAVLEPDSFTVFDQNTRQCIIKRGDGQEVMHDCAVDKQGEKIALSSAGYLTVYNALTGEQEWQKNMPVSYFLPIAFNQDDCIVSYDKKLQECSVHSRDETKIKRLLEVARLFGNSLFAHHPTKTEIIYNWDDLECCVSDYEKNRQCLYLAWQGMSPCCFMIGQQYTNDGSCIALMARESYRTYIKIINCGARQSSWIDLPKLYVSMLFHPNNKIFFLLDHKNNIECWNLAICQCVYTISVLSEEDIPLQSHAEKRLTLASNGYCLYAALKNKCVMIPLPIEILCGSEEKQDIMFKMWALSHDIHSDDAFAPLPKEMKYAMMKKLLKLYAK